MKKFSVILIAILAYSATVSGSAQNIKSKVDASASSSAAAATAKTSAAESSAAKAAAAQSTTGSQKSKCEWLFLTEPGFIANNSNWLVYTHAFPDNCSPSEQEVKQYFEEHRSELFLDYFMPNVQILRQRKCRVNAHISFIVGNKTLIHEFDKECDLVNAS